MQKDVVGHETAMPSAGAIETGFDHVVPSHCTLSAVYLPLASTLVPLPTPTQKVLDTQDSGMTSCMPGICTVGDQRDPSHFW